MASLVPSLLVVGYFVCIAVLNITTPAIFSLQPFNQTRNAVIATTLGKPNISVNSLASSNPTSFWLDSTPVVPYLAHSDRTSKIGLENGTLYDVVSKNNGKGTVSLNATAFNVSCGYVDGASVTDSGGSGNWSIGTPYQGNATSISVLAPDTFKWLPLYPYTLKDPWRHAVFYTSANITDSNGSNGIHISLNPPMQPGAHMDQSRKNVDNFSETVVYSIQIIGCTISLINQSAAVDAESHLLQHVSPSSVKSTSQWSSWQPETAPANATTVSVSLQSAKIAPRAEDTSPPAEQDPAPTIADPVTATTLAAERTDPIISPNNPTTDPYPIPRPITTEATPTTTEAAPTSTEQYNTTSIVDSMMALQTTTSSTWIDTTTSDSSSTKTDPPRTSRPTFSEDLQTSTSTYNGASFAPLQDPSPKPTPPNNGGGGEENTGEGNRIPTLASRQDSSPDPNNGGGSPPNTNPVPGNNDGGVGGAAPQDPSPEPAPPNNGGGEPKGASAPPNSNPNPAPPSDGGTSGGGDTPQFASPQDSKPNPAPPNNGGNSPQPPPAPQNPDPNPTPPNNNDVGTPPQNSNPGSDDSGGVGGAAPQDPNPKPASPNSDDGGGGGAPHNSNSSPAPDGGGGDRNPQFASPQDPNPNPAPPSSGGGGNSGNGDGGNGNGNGGNGGAGGGGNSGQGTNTPGQGQGQSNPPTAQSGSSGQGQSNPGQGGTSPQGGGGQGDGQQNSNFGAAGEPPSDNPNTTPQNPPAAQGQDTTGGQQIPPGTGNTPPAGNGDDNTSGQSNGGDGAGQNGGGDTGDGTQDTGGTGGTSGQDSGAGTQGTGDTSKQGAAGESGGGAAGDNSDGTQSAGGTSGQDSGSQPGTGGTGDTSGQGPGGENGGAEGTCSDGNTFGGATDQPMPTPTSNGAEPPTAAVVMVTSTTIKTTMINATTTATAVRSSGTPATVSYYDSSDVFLGAWWELFNQAALSRFPSTDDCPGHPWQNPEVCNPFTVIEQFVLEDLGLYPVLLDSPIRSGSKVTTLHDLENSLASARQRPTGLVPLYTIGGGMKDSDPSNAANNNYKVAAAAGNATMEYPYTVMRLTINLTPLLMGQVASILLFILVWYLVGQPVRSDSGIDTVGLLQIVWFMRVRPELQRIIADVDRPTVEHLRKAGMVNTSLDGVGDETRPLAGGGE